MKHTLFFPRRLNAADAGFFFLGRRADCNVSMVMVGVLECEITFEAMLQELTAAGEEVPRFKDYLRRAPLDLAPPLWMPRASFKVAEQVHETCLERGSWEEAITVIDRFQAAPMPEGMPPWEILLVRGLKDGRAVMAMKVHHALSDGKALSLLFAKAFGRKFLANSGVEVVAESEAPPAGSAAGLAFADAAEAARSWLGSATESLPELFRSSARRRRELESVRQRLRQRTRSEASGYSRNRLLSGFRIGAETWKAAARARGGSPNDLYLALVARAMRRHFPSWDIDARPLQLVMPVDVRGEADIQDGGNVTGVGIVELTGRVEDLDDLSRVRSRSRAVQQAIGESEPSLLDEMLQLLPGRAQAAIQFREFASRDAVATNVPMPIPGELCGVPFEMMFMVAPPIGAAVGFSLSSYDEQFYLAANADADVAGPVEQSVAAALEEVFDQPAESLRGGTMGATAIRAGA
jgi:diacylglycerol O-acyltransferase